MRLTKKAEYAIRAMVDLTASYDNQPVMSKEVAERQDIPASFLVQIIPELKRAGLILTTRGNGGGIYLNRKPSEVNVKEIIEAIEGPIALNQCLIGEDGCSRKPTCPMHTVWYMAQAQMLSVLEQATLAGLVGLAGSKAAPVKTIPLGSTGKLSNEVEVEV